MMVVEGRSEGFGLAQIGQDTPKIAGRTERRAQGESEIDGLRARVTLVWQMPEGTERLLEISHGLAVGRPRHGLLPRLPAVVESLIPHLALGEVVRQFRVMLLQAVLIQCFDGLPNGPVQGLAALPQ